MLSKQAKIRRGESTPKNMKGIVQNRNFRAFNPFFLDFCHSVLLVAVDVGAPK